MVPPWRTETHERALVRGETAPGGQALMDWGDFGHWKGERLYGFVFTLNRPPGVYVEFAQRQDLDTLLRCRVNAIRFFRAEPETVLSDNDRKLSCHPNMQDFANYYRFAVAFRIPSRPQAKGNIEATIQFIKSNFCPGLSFDSLDDLNRQAATWCENANRRVMGPSGALQLSAGVWKQTPINGQLGYAPSGIRRLQVVMENLPSGPAQQH
jgi:transposase